MFSAGTISKPSRRSLETRDHALGLDVDIALVAAVGYANPVTCNPAPARWGEFHKGALERSSCCPKTINLTPRSELRRFVFSVCTGMARLGGSILNQGTVREYGI